MATFLILPTRAQTGARLAELLEPLVPPRTWSENDWPRLGELLERALLSPGSIFPIFLDELTDGGLSEAELCDSFGAEPGDHIIRIAAGKNEQPTKWTVGPRTAA